MPGPPEGPSLRITTTSPGLMPCCSTTAKHSSSEAKTRAGPVCFRRSSPATLTTQPSGARLPRRMTRPPVGLSGFESGRTTSWPGVSCDAAAPLPHCLPGAGDRPPIQDARLVEPLRQDADPAGLEEILGD